MTETKILVADDDEQLLEMMVRRLKRNGFDADRAGDGHAAMKMIQNRLYDLLVTDLYMPGATGLALMRAAKERDPQVQVVVVTGSATMENAIEALNNGAFGYLNKPFDHVSVFDNMVARALEFRRLILDNQRMAEIQRKRGDLLEEEVTERVKQQRELQKEMLELVASLPDGILLVEEGGRVVLSSPVAEKWLAREMRTGGQPIQRFIETLYDEWAEERLEVEIDSESVLLQAIDLASTDEKKRKVVIIHVLENKPNGHLSDMMHDPLESLKSGLSWLYRRQMGSDVNQILMTLANQVSTLEQFAEEAVKSNGHQTAELAEIEGIPSLETLSHMERAEEELDLGGTLDLGDGALMESAKAIAQEDSVNEELDLGRTLDVGDGALMESAEAIAQEDTESVGVMDAAVEPQMEPEKPVAEIPDTQAGPTRRLLQKDRWTDLLEEVESQEDPADSMESEQIEKEPLDDKKFETFLDVLDKAAKDCPPDNDTSTSVNGATEKTRRSGVQEHTNLKTGEWPPLPPSKTERLDPSIFKR